MNSTCEQFIPSERQDSFPKEVVRCPAEKTNDRIRKLHVKERTHLGAHDARLYFSTAHDRSQKASIQLPQQTTDWVEVILAFEKI